MGGIEIILCGDNEPAKQLLWQRIEEKNRLFRHEHPLLNPMLVTKIFKYASPTYTDLKSFRLVCKLWHDLTLPKWRETATLKLNKETEQLTTLPFTKTGIAISKFLNLLENSEENLFQLDKLPFKRYKLFNVEINLGQIENPASKKFWRKLGTKIKYLHLEQCTLVQSVSSEVPVETLILEKAKYLEELVVTQVKIRKSESTNQRPKSLVTLIRERPRIASQLKSLTVDGETCPFTIPEVVRCSGKLEKLSLKNVKNLDENLWKSLFAFRRLSGFQRFNLTEIDLLKVPNGLTVMDGLHKARLPVKTFRAQIRPGQELEMVRIMAGFGWTLETLEIFRGDFGELGNLHNVFVGELPALKELRVWGDVVKNLDVLRFMPKLKVLWMNLLCAEKWNGEHGTFETLDRDLVGEMGRNEIFAGVESFRIDYEFGEESLRKIRKMMPNLKSLETVLSIKGFGTVGEIWPGLEDLGCLLGSRIDDGAITGTRLPVRWRKEEDDGEGLGLGIKQFRNLKTFRLEDFCGKAKLTDECLSNGFLEMFRLENLHICVSKEMSSKAEAILKQTFPHVQIIRKYDKVPGWMTEDELINHRVDCLACKTEELLDIQRIQRGLGIWEGVGNGASTPSTVVMMEENED